MKKHSFGKHQKDILETLRGSDMLVGYLLSARSTKRMFQVASKRAMYRQQMNRALNSLHANGYVSIGKDGLVQLTAAGTAAAHAQVELLSIRSRNISWDGKWRLLMFDIPESMRHERDALRYILRKAEFKCIQQSVYVHTHDCDELVAWVTAHKHLTGRVLYVVAESTNAHAYLKKVWKK